MNRSTPFLSRILLALALVLATAPALQARPPVPTPTIPVVAAGSTPVVAGIFNFRTGTSRSWVVRVAALGMILALFIIMRGSSRY
jgi:hypothetical protein